LKNNKQIEDSSNNINQPNPSELFQHHNFDINIDLAIPSNGKLFIKYQSKLLFFLVLQKILFYLFEILSTKLNPTT
jgi:hypothetical protein